MQDLISIIVPIYNVEKYITRCLDSIINQTYKNIEIILVDDGSPDNCGEICDDYAKIDNRIKVIHKKNKGVSSARNSGINIAKGKYIMFVDGDDWIEKNMVEDMYEKIIINNCEIVRCNFFIDNTETAVINERRILNLGLVSTKKEKEKILEDMILGKLDTYVVLLLIKKEIIKKKFDESLFFMEDMIFYIELFKTANVIYCYDKPLYHYFYNDMSITKIINEDKTIIKINQMLLVYKRILEIIKKNDIVVEQEKITQHYCRKILYLIYETYLSNYTINIKKIVNYSDDELQNLFNNCKYQNISIYTSLQLLLIKFKSYKLLKVVFFIKKYVNKYVNKNKVK